jgi:signal transduction histidine kinase
MSSLGQLVAGVAHEINNPVSFVCGNLKYVQQYSQDLLEIICLYQSHYPNPEPTIKAALAEKDLDFIVEDLPKSVSSIQVGGERIQDIIRSLRSFSRSDEVGVKLADLREGLDSTLVILASRLKAKPHCPAIEVIKHYDHLPLIACYPGQLNQVFMNLLSNAIDAIEERVEYEAQRFLVTSDAIAALNRTTSQSEGVPSEEFQTALPAQIRIRAELVSPDHIAIRIADTGIGIFDTLQQRIFEPFFTTKKVGQGTGLGLAVSYQIIKRHQGQLTYTSTRLRGTEFVVQLPISQPTDGSM